jgi:hypothetical protein
LFKYKTQTLKLNRGWTDDNGITHPRNWHIWSTEEKTAAGVTEVIEDTPPDSRLYNWSMDGDGKITSTAKALTDAGSGDSLVLGVKSSLKNEVKLQQGSLLSQTDWAVVRKSEKSTAIPSNIATWRDAIRTKATAMESAIDGAADTAAVGALFVTLDAEGGRVSGILYDWPILGS